jgi:hypothetical protein
MKLDDICRALKSLDREKDWNERYRFVELLPPEIRDEVLSIFGLLPDDARARERILKSMELDRRLLVELQDLIARYWHMVSSIHHQTDGKVEVDLWEMYESLVRHSWYMLRRMYPGDSAEVCVQKAQKHWEIRDQPPPPARPSCTSFRLPPLPEDKQRQMANATSLELTRMWEERVIFGTFFNGKHKCANRGRPPDPEIEFRGKCIAAYTLFLDREGVHHKAAIQDAVARYRVSKTTVLEARKQWCGEMRHLQFDTATAKEYREALERVEEWHAARSSHKIWKHLKPTIAALSVR